MPRAHWLKARWRKWWLSAAISVGAAAGLWAYAHRVERARVSLEQFSYAVRGTGAPRSGLTILHLSDFHFRADDPVQEARLARLTELLRGERYDVLAFTGDLIHDMDGLPRALDYLRGLRPERAAFCVPGNRDYWGSAFRALLGTPEQRAGLSAGKIARLIGGKARQMLRAYAGNERAALRVTRHDTGRLLAGLAEIGIRPLINCAASVTGGGADLWFAGVDDLNNGEPDLDAALRAVPPHAPLVLLAHNPDVWLEPRARRADLILSGHTHGGQLRLPLLGAWYRQGTHLPRGKAAGWFEDGDSAMYVTRGLGESFPYRFRAPPQAALIRLVRDESEARA